MLSGVVTIYGITTHHLRGSVRAHIYAVARMNMADLELKHAGEVVWKIDSWDRRLDPRKPYITFAFGRDP